MREYICAAGGIVGGAIAYLFGGWSSAIIVLLICMAIDYLSGLIVAGVFHASPKSKHGGLESKAGWKGLLRKFVTLMIVVVANMIDKLLGLTYIRDAVVIAFSLNEVISIIENAGLMGVPIPAALMGAIDLLQDKSKEMNIMGKNEEKCANEDCWHEKCPFKTKTEQADCMGYIEREGE